MANIPTPMLMLRSAVAGKVPNFRQLQYGQIAINVADRKIFTLGKDGQTVLQLGMGPGDFAPVAFSGKFSDLTDAPDFYQYTLPTAKSDALGGVMIGQGLTSTADGLLSADVQSVAGRKGNVVLQGQDIGLPNDLVDGQQVIQLKYIPSSITGAMKYSGSYKLSGPALPAAAPANNGWLYVASEAGSVRLPGQADPVTLRVGDWIVSNGTAWEVIPNVSGTISSVNQQTGDVIITLSALGAARVAETGDYKDLLNIPTDFVPKAHTHPLTDIIGIAKVAGTGDFNDLLNTPKGFSIANIAVNAAAETFLTQDISYLFTRAVEFPANFTASVCVAELTGANLSTVVIQRNGTQIGTITINGTVGTFTGTGAQRFAVGDKLTYHWNTLNIKNITINLQGAWL